MDTRNGVLAGVSMRTCKYTNYCEGLDQKHKIITCQLWGRENMSDENITKHQMESGE